MTSSSTTRRFWIAAALLALLLPATGLGATCADLSNCFIFWAESPADVDTVAQAHGLTVIDQVHDAVPELVLADGPPGVDPAVTLAALAADQLVLGSQGARLASLAEDDDDWDDDDSELAALDQSYTGVVEDDAFVVDPWSGYLDQDATAAIRLAETHSLPHVEARGTGVVAIIDTGVDPNHELLQGALVTGYDFLTHQLGIPSEWAALDPAAAPTTETTLRAAADQSYTGVVEGSSVSVATGPGIRVVVDQSYTGVVEGENLPAAFGHGTMVAGIVRMVAPGAKIMPLRAFDGDGQGELWDIVKAVFFATLAGADVINMSFSLEDHSEALMHAINFAKFLGVVCVSSAGNEGNASLTYPAALGNVIGVGSTDPDDNVSTFSNTGMGLVTVAAPGEAIVTTYPGDLYAGAWGTSFSAAFVSGTVALLNEWRTFFGQPYLKTVNFALGEMALEDSAYNPDPVNETDWGAGRVDARAAFSLGLVGE